MSEIVCTQCNNPIEPSDKFCPHCGSPIPSDKQQSASSSTKTISSSGNYSGTMVKGKGAGTRKKIRNTMIAIGLIVTIALIIWIKTDPNAKEKLSNILFGFTVMAIFGALIWRKSKKGLIKSTKQRQADFDYDDDYGNDGIDDDDD